MISISYDFVIVANILLVVAQFAPSLGVAWYPNRSGYASSFDDTEAPQSKKCETISLNVIILLLFNVGFIAGAEERGAYPMYTSFVWSTLSLSCIALGLVMVDRAVAAVEISDLLSAHPVGLLTHDDDLPEKQREWLKSEGLPGWSVVTVGAVSMGVMMSTDSQFVLLILMGYILIPVAMLLIMYHRMGIVSSHFHQYAGITLWVVATGIILLGLFE
jgi:hypothetical protein